jgi:phosphatase NudJ
MSRPPQRSRQRSQQRFRPSVTVAAVIERDGRFLLVEESTPEGPRLNNPAGHLERGESPLDAVVREALEETGCVFKPEAVLGVYLSRFVRPARQEDVTYLRIAYRGTVGGPEPGRELDQGILRTLWLTADEIRAESAHHRSPLVMRCIDDFIAGQSLPLTAVQADGSLSTPEVKEGGEPREPRPPRSDRPPRERRPSADNRGPMQDNPDTPTDTAGTAHTADAVLAHTVAEGAAAPSAEGDAPNPAAAAPRAPEPSWAETAAALAARFPALFTPGAFKPLKLRVQADIQERTQGAFTRKQLGIFLHRHTTSTAYLKAMVASAHRYDLDGNEAGELAAEHRDAAGVELERRWQIVLDKRAAARAAQRANQPPQATTAGPAGQANQAGGPAETGNAAAGAPRADRPPRSHQAQRPDAPRGDRRPPGDRPERFARRDGPGHRGGPGGPGGMPRGPP